MTEGQRPLQTVADMGCHDGAIILWDLSER